MLPWQEKGLVQLQGENKEGYETQSVWRLPHRKGEKGFGGREGDRAYQILL